MGPIQRYTAKEKSSAKPGMDLLTQMIQSSRLCHGSYSKHRKYHCSDYEACKCGRGPVSRKISQIGAGISGSLPRKNMENRVTPTSISFLLSSFFTANLLLGELYLC